MAIPFEIALKQNSNIPVIFNQTNVITEKGRACFPYPNFWRGDYNSSVPIVVHRQAGFRPRECSKLPPTKSTGHAYPQHCFAASPSTRYPCYPECIDYIEDHKPYIMKYGKIFTYR